LDLTRRSNGRIEKTCTIQVNIFKICVHKMLFGWSKQVDLWLLWSIEMRTGFDGWGPLGRPKLGRENMLNPDLKET